MPKTSTETELTTEETEALYQSERTLMIEARVTARAIAVSLVPDLADLPDYAQVAIVDRAYDLAVEFDRKMRVDPKKTAKETQSLCAAFDMARTIAASYFPDFATLPGYTRFCIGDVVYSLVIVLKNDGTVDEEATMENAADTEAALEDSVTHEFARKVYGSESPLAFLAAAEAEDAWFEEEDEGE